MVRTQVGYAGGTKEDPNYHALGDYAETIKIDYDPAIVSYAELLEIFWKSHDPVSRPWSRQYMSAIFYHDEEQKKQAAESLEREEAGRHRKIYTEILPAGKFYPAEDYHQKYYLRQNPELITEFRKIRPEGNFVDSTAAARINGFLAGHGSCRYLSDELSHFLSPAESARIITVLRGMDARCN